MKLQLMIIFISISLIFGCHSNKGGHKAHGKKGKHTSVASSGNSAGSSRSSSISNTDTSATSKYHKTRFGEGRPRINSGGVSGVGSGGSYASNSYRRDILNKDEPSLNKKEYFKKRMEEEDRMYYGEEIKQELPVIEQDTSFIETNVDGFESDTLSLNK